MAHVVMGPIAVEDPSLFLQPLSERSARKGGENGEGGKFDIVSLDKFNRSLKDSRIIPIKAEDERTVNANPVILNVSNQIGQFPCIHKSFRNIIQIQNR